MFKKFAIKTFILLCICIIGNAYGANVIWDDGGGDNAWTNGINWDGNTVPVSADTAYIDWSPDYNSIDIGCDVTLNAVTTITGMYGPGARSPAEVGSSSLSLGTGAYLKVTGRINAADAQDANTTVVVDVTDDAQLTANSFYSHHGYSSDPGQIPVGSFAAQRSRELTLNIGDNAVVDFIGVSDRGLRHRGYGHMTMNVTGNADLHIGGSQFRCTDKQGGFTFNMSGNPTVNLDAEWKLGDSYDSLADMTIDSGTIISSQALTNNAEATSVDIVMNGGSVNFAKQLGFQASKNPLYSAYCKLTVNGGEWIHGWGMNFATGSGAPGCYGQLNVHGGLCEFQGLSPKYNQNRFRAPGSNPAYYKSAYLHLTGGYLNAGNCPLDSTDPNYFFIDVNDRDSGGIAIFGLDANAFNLINTVNDLGGMAVSISDSNNAFRFKYIGPDNERGVTYLGITPKRQAWGPWPYNRDLYTAQTMTLNWQVADIIDAADSQKLYTGTDKAAIDAIAAGGAGQTATYGSGTSSHLLTGLSPLLTNYWRIDSNSGGIWTKGDLWQFGSPQGKAEHPDPAHNSTVSDADLTLRWDPSPWPAFLLNQNVYYGDNVTAVTDANTSTVGIFQGNYAADVNSYNVGALPLGAVRWWRIDSNMNTGDLVKGDVWKFTMAQFLTLEDFDWYQGTTNLRATWLDYYSDSTNGVVVTEQTEPNRYAKHSKLMDFDWITSGYTHWDTKRTFASPFDMTTADLAALVLYSYGDPCNTSGTPLYSLTGPQKIYVTLSDDTNSVTLPYDGDANNIFVDQWVEWNLALADFAPVDLTQVASIMLSVTDDETGNGHVKFDDIRLYKQRCVPHLSGVTAYDVATVDCIINFRETEGMRKVWLQTGTSYDFHPTDPICNVLDYVLLADVWQMGDLFPK
ncbi:MAG: hypothetical protein ACYTBP_13710 [Planctomycetota bacterium]|jgi:hypothetical protein